MLRTLSLCDDHTPNGTAAEMDMTTVTPIKAIVSIVLSHSWNNASRNRATTVKIASLKLPTFQVSIPAPTMKAGHGIHCKASRSRTKMVVSTSLIRRNIQPQCLVTQETVMSTHLPRSVPKRQVPSSQVSSSKPNRRNTVSLAPIWSGNVEIASFPVPLPTPHKETANTVGMPTHRMKGRNHRGRMPPDMLRAA